jgi:hypothetical protein
MPFATSAESTEPIFMGVYSDLLDRVRGRVPVAQLRAPSGRLD